MIALFQDRKKYDARLDQELKILNVEKDDEYIYTLAIDYRSISGASLEEFFRVTVDVKGIRWSWTVIYGIAVSLLPRTIGPSHTFRTLQR